MKEAYILQSGSSSGLHVSGEIADGGEEPNGVLREGTVTIRRGGTKWGPERRYRYYQKGRNQMGS